MDDTRSLANWTGNSWDPNTPSVRLVDIFFALERFILKLEFSFSNYYLSWSYHIWYFDVLSREIIIEIIAELIYQMLVGLAKLQGTLDLHQVCFYYRYVSLGGKWFVIYCYYGHDWRLLY